MAAELLQKGMKSYNILKYMLNVVVTSFVYVFGAVQQGKLFMKCCDPALIRSQPHHVFDFVAFFSAF